jgi:hypothetical protein
MGGDGRSWVGAGVQLLLLPLLALLLLLLLPLLLLPPAHPTSQDTGNPGSRKCANTQAKPIPSLTPRGPHKPNSTLPQTP